MDQLISRNRMLADFQQSGRKLPEAPNVESLRKLLEGNCRIIYELLLNEQILILKIHHISRLLDCLVDR